MQEVRKIQHSVTDRSGMNAAKLWGHWFRWALNRIFAIIKKKFLDLPTAIFIPKAGFFHLQQNQILLEKKTFLENFWTKFKHYCLRTYNLWPGLSVLGFIRPTISLIEVKSMRRNFPLACNIFLLCFPVLQMGKKRGKRRIIPGVGWWLGGHARERKH